LLADYLKRPEVDWDAICEMEPELKSLEIPELAAEQTVIEIKYAGYIARQTIDVEKQKKAQSLTIPDWFDYNSLNQLRKEAQEKLTRVKPRDIAQASRISGITPADLAIVTLHIQNPGKLSKS